MLFSSFIDVVGSFGANQAELLRRAVLKAVAMIS